MKRIILLFLSLTLLCACALTKPSATPKPTPTPDYPEFPPAPTARELAVQEDWPDDGRFTLRYADDSTLNPYSCGTEVNRLLCSLLFEPLIGITADFQPESALCTEWSTSDGGVTFELSLRDNILFSDGSAMTYWDLLYSLNRAKEETSFYCERLKCISDIAWTGEKLRITLSSPQPRFPLLLDVPIVKEGSAYRSLPIGTGPYEFHEDADGAFLSPNPYYPDTGIVPFDRIDLKYFSVEELASAFEAGEVDLLVSDPGVMGQSAFAGAVRRSLPTTILYYLGLNPSSEPLSDPARRRLVNAAINRGSLAGILGGDATLLPIHPLLPEYDEAAAKAWIPSDLSEYCIEILTEDYNGDGILEYFRDGVPTDFSFRLLVCSENEAGTAAARSIADDLKNKGIKTELRLLNETDFLQAVKRRDYDMFLGSMRLTADFDLTGLFRDYGDDMLQKLAQNLRAADGEERTMTASELCSYSAECCRIIPLVFLRRVIYSRQGSVRETDPSWTDPFRHVTAWVTADK